MKKNRILIAILSLVIFTTSCTTTSIGIRKTKKSEWTFDNYLLEAQVYTNKRRYLSAIKLLQQMQAKFPETERVMTSYLIGYNYYELKSFKVARKYLDTTFFLFRDLSGKDEQQENEKFTHLATILLSKMDEAEETFDPYDLESEKNKAKKEIKPAF